MSKPLQFVFAAGVEAVVRGGHIAAEALHITQLRADAEHIVAVVGREQVVHGDEALVGDKGENVAHVAPDACRLEGRREFLAGARTHRVVDGVVGIGKRNLAVDDAGQRIRTLDSGTEADGLEEGLRSGARRP